ncbi:hypothetical protein SAMN05421863_11561 [Nitrosomonas communis]|uniref:Uncharacterized protein n=1 Tax=Nitrosomonas communis TaxID=44574 RepID=A0A1I4XH86_9PROT|nr:hypothetical protein SAMN05421863_11561 [Nitrosomonas communis]
MVGLEGYGIPKITEALSLNPSLSESTQNCQLLLGSTPIDEAFAKGAETACASYSDSHQGALPAFQRIPPTPPPIHIPSTMLQ